MLNYEAPPDSAYGLWYYPSLNRFMDEDGEILHDFTDLFDVWQLDRWKKEKQYGLLTDRYGNLCELYYLDPFDEATIEVVCNNKCDSCPDKLCSVYPLWREWKNEHLEY